MDYSRPSLLAAVWLALAALPASAQGLLDAICEAATERGETATAAEYRADPGAHADDFCALARHEPHKAARQLSKMIRTTRLTDNPNRYYLDRRTGLDGYIQLLRPWMDDANRRGVAKWTVRRYEDYYYSSDGPSASIVITDDMVADPMCRPGAYVRIERGVSATKWGSTDSGYVDGYQYFDVSVRVTGYSADPINTRSVGSHGETDWRTLADLKGIEAALDEYRPRPPNRSACP